MKKLILTVILSTLMITACGQAAPGTENATGQQSAVFPTPDWKSIPDPLPQSMKGYELYAWQTESGWVYTLVTGTNRNKSFEEITTPGNNTDGEGLIKVTVAGLEDLMTLLRRLPTGEEVFWSGINLSGQVSEGTLYFSYPPEEQITKILQLAEEVGIKVHTLQNQ